jgi:hypothetical protein
MVTHINLTRSVEGHRRKQMKRFVIVLAFVLLPVFNLAPAALATRPARGCADHFIQSDNSSLIAFLHETFPNFPLASIKQIVAKSDKNADQQVCYKQIGGGYYSIIDNTANQEMIGLGAAKA